MSKFHPRLFYSVRKKNKMSSDDDTNGGGSRGGFNGSDDGDAATVVVASHASASLTSHASTSISQDDGVGGMSDVSGASSHQPLKIKSGSWLVGQQSVSSQHSATSKSNQPSQQEVGIHRSVSDTFIKQTDVGIELSSRRASEVASIRSVGIELSSHRFSSPSQPIDDKQLKQPMTPRRVFQLSNANHGKPWSPQGPCASPKSFEKRRSSGDDRQPFTPVIDRNSKKYAAKNRDMANQSLLHGRDKEDNRKAAIKKEIRDYFKPDTADNAKSNKKMMDKNDDLKQYMQQPVFSRLYERVQVDDTNRQEKKSEMLQKEQEEFPQWKPCVNYKYTSADYVRTPEARQQWHDLKNMKIDQIRSVVQKNEVREMQSAPKLNTHSRKLAAQKNSRVGQQNVPVEDRLIDFGNRAKQDRLIQLEEEEAKCRDEASPHISIHAAMTTTKQSAHERLYYSKNISSSHIQDDDNDSTASGATCTFQPAISKKSHVLAGGELPKTERVEDRLLRLGKERNIRNTEKQSDLNTVDQDQRKGRQNVGPFSKLLNQLAKQSGRKRSFSDPIGVNNSEVVAQLRAKHEPGIGFKPFIGQNSRHIDRQIHGDRKLSWEERIGNLYFKAKEKESKLERLRLEKQFEESTQVKAQGVPSSSSTPRNGDEMHARNRAWKQRLENKRRWGKHHLEEEEVRECTFKPIINRTSSIKRGSVNRARSGSPSVRSPKHVDFATSEMQHEMFRHQAVASHISTQLSPVKSPLRATSLGTTYEELDDDSDRQELLRQLDFYRNQIALEDRRT